MADNTIRDSLPRTPIRGLTSLLVRTMALLCVRNTALEDIHAGRAPVTRTGDWSDVTVVDAEGRCILWPEVSHFGDDAMRELMREIVDNLYNLYTFLLLSREPGFLERAAIWMRSASRWDEPKIVEDFLPGFTAANNYKVAPLFGVDVCRFAFAPHPELIEEGCYGIRIFLQDRDGSQWSVDTELVTQDLETGYFLAQTLNNRLGLDVAACEMFAEQVMTNNPTGRHQRSRPL